MRLVWGQDSLKLFSPSEGFIVPVTSILHLYHIAAIVIDISPLTYTIFSSYLIIPLIFDPKV